MTSEVVCGVKVRRRVLLPPDAGRIAIERKYWWNGSPMGEWMVILSPASHGTSGPALAQASAGRKRNTGGG